jgi:hypothetical protein
VRVAGAPSLHTDRWMRSLRSPKADPDVGGLGDCRSGRPLSPALHPPAELHSVSLVAEAASGGPRIGQTHPRHLRDASLASSTPTSGSVATLAAAGNAAVSEKVLAGGFEGSPRFDTRTDAARGAPSALSLSATASAEQTCADSDGQVTVQQRAASPAGGGQVSLLGLLAAAQGWPAASRGKSPRATLPVPPSEPAYAGGTPQLHHVPQLSPPTRAHAPRPSSPLPSLSTLLHWPGSPQPVRVPAGAPAKEASGLQSSTPVMPPPPPQLSSSSRAGAVSGMTPMPYGSSAQEPPAPAPDGCRPSVASPSPSQQPADRHASRAAGVIAVRSPALHASRAVTSPAAPPQQPHQRSHRLPPRAPVPM